MSVEFKEHTSASYAPRTWSNAAAGDITIAIAADESTAGERLTQKAASGKILKYKISKDDLLGVSKKQLIEKITQEVVAFNNKKQIKTINFAGNGIYTLNKFGIEQDVINSLLVDLCESLLEKISFNIRSGGQTGVDWAGAVAAGVLGVDAVILFPKGFLQRSTEKLDYQNSVEKLQAVLAKDCQKFTQSKHSQNNCDEAPFSTEHIKSNQEITPAGARVNKSINIKFKF